jgi:hypothetical protein
LLQNRKISEYPVGESTHLLKNHEIFDIRIDYFLSEWCCESAKYPKISSRISAGALLYTCTVYTAVHWRGCLNHHRAIFSTGEGAVFVPVDVEIAGELGKEARAFYR